MKTDQIKQHIKDTTIDTDLFCAPKKGFETNLLIVFFAVAITVLPVVVMVYTY